MKTRLAILATTSLAFSSAVQAAPWSPDGSKIVYSYIGGPENIYIVNADGSDQQDLVIRSVRDFRPEWAPDGSHILFTSTIDGKHVIMKINPDGSNLEQLTQPAQAAGGADYSPDGSHYVYFTDEPRARDLYIHDLATGSDKALTQTPAFSEMSPRWSTDGRTIAFVGQGHTEGAESDIWTIDIETGERQNITQTDDIGEFHPDWSRDGKSVVYIRVKNGTFDVAVRNFETLDETIIASGNGYAVLSPHFSPDDTEVSFTRTDFAERGEGMPAIVSVRLDDKREKLIAKGLYLSQMD